MLGLAILSRQSWIFAVPAAALSCWFAAKAKGVATHAIGLAAGIGLAALFAPWSEYWFWNFKSSPGFVFASVDVGWVVSRGLAAVGIFVAFHLALVVAAGSTLPASLRREPDLWLWALTGLAATSAGFRFYGHYWLQLLPPLVLLAAPVLAAASVRRQRLAQASLAVGAVVALVLLFVPHAFRDRPDPAPLAATIRQCTAVDQRVFVWGSFPELSVLVDRPAAGRLVHMDFVTGRSGGRSGGSDAVTPGARTKMMDDLRADPPTVLVDTSGVSNLGYQAFPMLGQPELGDFARAGYTPQAVAGGFVLWWINGHVPCAAATP
jgi:hypothetical protein